MSTPSVVWLVIGLLTIAAVGAVLIALIRHLFVLWRAIGRFQDEVGALSEEINLETDRASARSQDLAHERPFDRS
ncbi:MAG TPA: hypothetical protein VIC58_02420 [Actinomycetota bacterium]|jgi:hypothetical protein